MNQQELLRGKSMPIIARKTFEVTYNDDGGVVAIESQHVEVSPSGVLLFFNFERVNDQLMPRLHTAFATGVWSEVRPQLVKH